MIRFTIAASAVAISTAMSCAPASARDAEAVPAETEEARRAEQIVVTGQRAETVQIGILGTRSIQNTPFSISTFSTDPAANGVATQLVEIIGRDAAIQVAEPGNEFTFTSIRGVTGQNDSFYTFDGLPGLIEQYQPMLEPHQRVDILKGPATTLIGFNSIGGTINLVPKRASANGNLDIGGQFVGRGNFGANVDFGRRFGSNDQFGVRVNVAGRGGDGYQDFNRNSLLLGSIALDYRTERLKVTLDAHANRREINGYEYYLSLAPGLALPEAPSGRINIGQPYTNFQSDYRMAVLQAKYAVSDKFNLSAAIGGNQFEPSYFYLFGGIINAAGDTRKSLFNEVPRIQQQSVIQVQANGQLAIGGWENDVTLNAQRMTFFDRGTFAETAVVALSNIYNPIYDRTPISFPPNDVSNGFPFAFFSERRSVGLVNSISHPTIPLELILGGRYQHVRNDNRGIGAPAGFEIEQGHFAPSGGVVWKATPQVSVYANYAEGLEPGQVVQPPASNAGDIINPFVSHQIEGGVKLRLDAFTADIAAFRFIRPAAFLDPVTNRFEQLGERRFQGIDANFTARVTDRVRLDGGILILDAELTSTGDINGDGQVGDLNGNTAPGVSPTRIVLGGEFDVVRSERSTLTLTSRVTHNGSIFFNLDNTIKLPAVTVLDIGARFEHRPSSGGRWFATVNVTNLTNERYWQTFDEFLLLNTGAPTVFRLAIGRSF